MAGSGSLARIDPATGATLQTTPYNPPVTSRPVIVGNTVWVVASYNGGDIVLHGYDSRTLAQVASVPVPAIGGVSDQAAGRAGRRARRQALRGRGRHRGHRGPGRPRR